MAVRGKHTQGPWNVANDRGYDIGVYEIVGFYDRWEGREETNECVTEDNANLKLIEAAPDLLEAAKAAQSYLADRAIDEKLDSEEIDEVQAAYDGLSAVINKAEGNSEESD